MGIDYIRNTTGVLYETSNAYLSRAPLVFFGGVRIAHLFSSLCCLSLLLSNVYVKIQHIKQYNFTEYYCAMV